MEYRQRRSNARYRSGYRSDQYSRRRNDGGGGMLSLVLLVLMSAAIVYVVAATPFGTSLVKNLFGKAGSVVETPQPSASPITASETPQSIMNNDKPQTAEAEFALEPLEMYALQLGVYDSASNARGMINSLRSLGAAGYSLATEAGVRILASCYTTEAAANSVCERLNEQGYEGLVYPIKCAGAVLRVTADQEQLSAIERSAQLTKTIIDRLNEEVIRFDSEERSVGYGLAIANELLESIRSARASLEGINDPSGAISLLEEHFIELTGCFTLFISSAGENRVELSGNLKHLQLEVIDRYCVLLSKLREHIA